MLKKLQKRNSGGFTIIEVMIVLAIAALILLIVLLAIPALQRNSRNTAIKNDASAVASGISEYESNNDGSTPGYANAASGTVTICDANPCGSSVTKATAKVQGNTTVSSTTASGPGSPLSDPGVGTVKVYFKYRCDNSSSPRASAIVYDVETSGSPSVKCIDS